VSVDSKLLLVRVTARVVLWVDVRPDGSVVVTEFSGERLPNLGSGVCVVVTIVPSGTVTVVAPAVVKANELWRLLGSVF
jgi:hypothetical protein